MAHTTKVFEVEYEGDVLIVIPQGDSLGFQESQLETAIDQLHKALDSPKAKNLVIDIGRASFLSSIVIGAIMALCVKCRENGGKAALCNASGSVLDVIQIMKLDTVFPYFPTRADAVNSMAAN